jgi:hypothetical protein
MRTRRDPSSFAFDGRDNTRYGSWIVAATILFLCDVYHCASANPLVNILDGSNWDLPIVRSVNAVVQRGVYQSSGTSYESHGKAISGPSTTAFSLTGRSGRARPAHSNAPSFSPE